ncbi:MAG: methylenetetrahydrofolate reductase [NAD(P)H] [Oscillospiraceae bacterium]|jgi:methylenetetrahydrofolate reductase (NADPH)|nr:methylenetetrahydrofolate reductase [NAD(P)H] [Oscillospiraceae bacterium]
MKISSMYKTNKTVFSFEVFPPKKTSSVDTVYSTLADLKELSPDYISVTYGAGGSAANASTRDIASYIKHTLGIESMAHLTCINSSREGVVATLRELKESGIENILALRGDINPDMPSATDFAYASDLIEFIGEDGGFDISAACYPEGHIESDSLIADIRNLWRKVDAGARSLVSQLFFDNSYFYSFAEKAEIAGISVPISAGIMPVTNKSQIERMVTMCGASLPPKFVKMMSRYESNPAALLDAGVAYAIDQIVDLISNGADGIHLYTMNRADIAKRITDSVKNLL